MTLLAFTVYGVPQPAGSKRAFPIKRPGGKLGVAVSDANPKSRDWKNAVASAAREAYSGPLLAHALEVSMVFVRPRPKGHIGARGLRSAATAYPTSRPDLLKLARAVEDALTAVVYCDDAQIVTETLSKRWGEVAMVEVTIGAAPWLLKVENREPEQIT